ncbi:anthranilate synthase component I family protein [Brevundimonas sp. NIBR11]|uniref:anthranilate synthase component I family protein n=1 Tax=Brevundimonas sp. NIBR11 TaxID=3015999 RepID=UPI0022F0C873|nr:anthranilate synthase component I family protein [Brevundimonas sp. NIBR11]WGM32348.1 Aminodeoxychorismate synthase component 1 [Brevundimonas sp. NIBR11]
MTARVVRTLDWIDPLAVAAGLADRDGAVCLLSDGGANGRQSYVACEPDRVVTARMAADRPFALLAEAGMDRFLIGLATYDAGARGATGDRGAAPGDWPDLTLARYPAMLVFDHQAGLVSALGLGADEVEAGEAAGRATDWIAEAATPRPGEAPATELEPERSGDDYLRAVADVVERIAAGEIFQANIARAWRGELKPGADPFEVFVRLAAGAAPYGAFWRMGERVLVSNSPELFLIFDPAGRRIETRPIKGTRPRDADSGVDAANAADLVASAKDRAENLMIVDLMRNDLSRAARPGSVRVEKLFALESFATVHHLVSTVTAEAQDGVGAAEVLAAAFPPGSITGAPKHQAMRVIAEHEPPRGPWCGSLFLLEHEGALTASVLIRTIGFHREGAGWAFRTLAGAGIVADSDPASELAETEAKIAAIRRALTG